MKELKSNECYTTKKASQSKSERGCRCSCKCNDESTYNDAHSLGEDGSINDPDNDPHCGCGSSHGASEYALNMV